MIDKKKVFKVIKLILSIIVGIAVGLIAIFYYFGYQYFYDAELDLLFLAAFLVSWIMFLILWNKRKSKLIFLLLIIPLIYFAGIVSIEAKYIWNNYVNKIERMPEERTGWTWQYEPFYPYPTHGYLAYLDEKSNLKLTDNLPVIDGATAFYPLYASFVETVYPMGNYSLSNKENIVLCSRTPNAYNNLLERKVDLIFCFEPSETQSAQFLDSGLNLKLVPIAKDAFVFFVNKINKVDSLTIEEIQKIYSGKIKNWIWLGGSFSKIRPFQRPHNSGSQTIFEKIMGDNRIIKPKGETVIEYMHAVVYEVAAYRNFGNAIGYTFLFYSQEMLKNDEIKYLAVNGVLPSKETIQDDSYPFTQYIYAIYIDDDKKNENIEPFIEWILSDQGQELVLKTGYTQIKSK